MRLGSSGLGVSNQFLEFLGLVRVSDGGASLGVSHPNLAREATITKQSYRMLKINSRETWFGNRNAMDHGHKFHASQKLPLF